jgi:protoporphyrinogen oxidase
VVVLDRAGAVGGLAASITVADQRVDLGSHRLHPSIRPDLLADVVELLGGDLQRRQRHGRIRLEGRWLAFPLRPTDLLRNARPAFAAWAVRDVAMAPWRRR